MGKIAWEKWDNKFPKGKPVVFGHDSEESVMGFLDSYRMHAELLLKDVGADHVLFAVLVPGIFKKYRFYMQPMNHAEFLESCNRNPKLTLFAVTSERYKNKTVPVNSRT